MAWSKSTRITVMLAIDTAFFFLEVGVGMIVGSLALMADAFHMLNDIISLLVGLWAWQRAEILGAFFNAVFLIALCLSIILEAITRLLDPPKISNPILILVVGSLELTSNVAGFFVLGHSHSETEQDDHADEVRIVEEGGGDGVQRIDVPGTEYAGTLRSTPSRAVDHHAHNPIGPTLVGTPSPIRDFPSRKKPMASNLRRQSRSGTWRIVDGSVHPASFRQEIVNLSKTIKNRAATATASEELEDDVAEEPSEAPLLGKSSKPKRTRDPFYGTRGAPPKPSHLGHNHNKLKQITKSESDMGTSAMILHVIGDGLGNAGVIASALIIWLTPWSGRFYADPAVSLFIAVIILKTTIPLTSASAKILLQGTPDHLDINDIKNDVQKIPGILHLWQLSETQPIASLHVQLDFSIERGEVAERYMTVVKAIRECLHEYGIHSATVQPEFCLDPEHDHADQVHISTSLDGSETPLPISGLDEDACLVGAQGTLAVHVPAELNSAHLPASLAGRRHSSAAFLQDATVQLLISPEQRTEQQSISYSSFSAIEMNLFNRSQNACPDILASNCSIDPEPKLPPQAEDPSNRKTLPVYNHNGDIVTKGIHPDGESGRRGFHPLHFFTVGWRSSSKVSLAVNVLWPFVPAGLAIHFARPDLHVWIFAINYIAMVPAANLVGFAGQQLARKLPKVTGILLETALGSVVEIVLFMVLIKKDSGTGNNASPRNLVPVIQAAILGSILTNILLCLGVCFFIGGLKLKQQSFHAAISEVGSGLLLVAGFALLIPSAFFSALRGSTTSSEGGGFTEVRLRNNTLKISQVTSIILIVAFLVYLWFNAHSQESIFHEVLASDEERDTDRHRDLHKAKLTFTECVIALAISLTFVTLIAIFLVEEIRDIVQTGVPENFLGLILVPLVEKAAEHLTTVDEAYDNQMVSTNISF
ncbi:calcium/proton exchanger, variant 3 [Exophiala oligosperma]|uniref:Calcium/proton exchanger, variant 3 n=1 Tax=Exophiala oligosperma TaxID=215243 RepID=A0A0D2A735_9EURO|nr:calcium/proton exchanger, variant 3 [Exophiala oligosperma]KIW36136.1 calcium/proton exchanger, variant 3 [Exophiala oligosperma]